MTALQKDGGVRGIVVGDVFRRLVREDGVCHPHRSGVDK